MTRLRPVPRDPRTVARDIPGVLDGLFPQLTPGLVMYLNGSAEGSLLCEPVKEELVAASSLQHAMLFELAVAVGEQSLDAREQVDWEGALASAVARQRRYFDAKLPARLSAEDKAIAEHVGENLAIMIEDIAGDGPIARSPVIPGYRWVSSGHGDFSCGSTIVEVKCTARPFGAADYRQVLMYWLLSYAASVEGRGAEWSNAILLNPRRAQLVSFSFDELVAAVGAGRSKVDLLELFSWLVGDHSSRGVEKL